MLQVIPPGKLRRTCCGVDTLYSKMDILLCPMELCTLQFGPRSRKVRRNNERPVLQIG